MKLARHESNKYLLGTVLILALLIGGGTARGLYTDSIIIGLSLLAAGFVFLSPSEQRVGFGQWALPALVVALCVLQILPLPSWILSPLRPELLNELDGASSRSEFISLGVGLTLESLVLVIAPLAFFLCVLRLRPDQVLGLLPFFFVGLVCNLLVGTLQYSLSANPTAEGLLPFGINAGLFANDNHFATLLFVSIPLIVFFGLYRGQMLTGGIGLVAVLLILLAADSRAGVLIGLAITVVSLITLPGRSRLTLAAGIAIFFALSIHGVGALSKIDPQNLDPDFGRVEFARTTLEGIRENWLLGVGFGNFVKAYQIYEHPEMIYPAYVNHAHNDYLELVFEGGVLAALLIALYFLMLIKAAFLRGSGALKRAALISIVFVLVHSIGDYPLRTLAIAMTFAFLNGILFHRGSRASGQTSDEFLQVEHNGERLLVPIARTGSDRRML